MSFRFSHLAFPLAVALGAQAQTTEPSASAHTHDEPIHLENLIVTATPFERAQADLAAPTSVLAGRALVLKLQPTLGESLHGQPGVSSTYFGPGASRPVIRGLGGDRIRVLANGLDAIDASTTSPDHAVALDPLLVERLEIVRGPAALLYGGNAIGGVVNVIDHRIHRTLPGSTFGGRATAHATSVDGGASGSALLEGATGPLAWHVDGYRRTSDDLRIPDFAKTAALRAEEIAHAAEEGEPAPEFARERLPNSSQSADGAAAGFSLIGARGYAGFAVSGHNALYGVPPGAHAHAEAPADPLAPPEPETAEETIRIDLRQRRLELQSALTQPFGIFEAARLKLGLAEYRHGELEGVAIGTVFKNQGYDGRLELTHRPFGRMAGAWGAQVSRNELQAIGAEAFLPPTRTARRALFVFEEAEWSALTWQFGARGETQKIETRDGSGRGRNGESMSVSTGFLWKLTDAWSLGTTLARSERQPNAQELFSDGPHLGTRAFEIGDAALGREKSLALDLSLRRRAGFVTGELTVFENRFDGFIYEQPTGEIQDGLDVYRYTQRDAEFHGAELETILHLHESPRHTLDLRVSGDLVRGELRDTGENLPRLTPRRSTLGVDYRGGAWSAGAEARFVDRARQLATNETPTDGHALLGAYVGCRFAFAGLDCDAVLRATNLTDEEARNHGSFLKDVAPLGGRAATLALRVSF
jgi:iron complex outermembrane receptor protein